MTSQQEHDALAKTQAALNQAAAALAAIANDLRRGNATPSNLAVAHFAEQAFEEARDAATDGLC